MGKYLDKEGVETLWAKTKELNAQKQDRTSDDLTTKAKGIVEAINETADAANAAQSRAEEVAEAAAKTDGYYAGMRVGTADNLTARGDATEEEFTRRKAGGDNAIEEGYATIKAVRGNSITLNQITDTFPAPTSHNDKSNIDIIVAEDKLSFRITGTIQAPGNNVDKNLYSLANSKKTIPKGHIVAGVVNNDTLQANLFENLQHITALGQCTFARMTETSNPRMAFTINPKAYGETIDITCRSMIFDLTQMFGAGNEPASPEEFAARLGYESVSDIPYIPYNEGQIVDMTATGIRTTGTDDGEAWTQERSWKPVLDKYFGGHLRSAGNVRDEITANKAVKRIASFDMSTRNWSSYSLNGVNIFFCHAPKDFPNSGNNILQTEYAVINSTIELKDSDKSICNDSYIGSNYALTIRDDSCATPAALIAKLKGKVLYYATTAPEEYDIDEQNLTERVSPDGTEEIITPESDDVIASAPLVADIVYPIDSYNTIKANKANIGSVSSLATSDKSDLVAAINELVGRVAALEAKSTETTSTTEEQ